MSCILEQYALDIANEMYFYHSDHGQGHIVTALMKVHMCFKVIPGEAGFRTDCFKI